MSSNTAYFYEDQDKDRVFRQNYHIANLSQSMFFNEILEYQVDYIIDNADSSTSSNLRQDARMQMIGIAALVTTNAYINQDSGLYPLFDQQNRVIGSQIIFGEKQGVKKDDRSMSLTRVNSSKSDLNMINQKEEPKLIFKI